MAAVVYRASLRSTMLWNAVEVAGRRRMRWGASQGRLHVSASHEGRAPGGGLSEHQCDGRGEP